MQRLSRSDQSDPLASMFMRIFSLAAIILGVFPFWLPLQDFLIRTLTHMEWYQPMQRVIFSYELHNVIVFLNSLRISIHTEYSTATTTFSSNEALYFLWNSVSWQSFLLFFITACTGLAGKHTMLSKWGTFLLGLVGMYVLTLFHLMSVLVLPVGITHPLGVVLHNYVTILLSFSWLIVFWWFAYRFVLKQTSRPSSPVAVERSRDGKKG